MIGTIILYRKIWYNSKKKKPNNDKWECCDVISLLLLLGVNHCQPPSHMSKKGIYINTTEKRINQFAMGYTVNHVLHISKVFRVQSEKSLRAKLSSTYHDWYKRWYENNNTCVIALEIFYKNRKNATTVYRVFTCVLHSVMEFFYFIDYLCCQSKTISDISSDKLSEHKSYNELNGIGIPEVLL